MITITGPRADKTSPTVLPGAIDAHGKVRIDGLKELYRVENPTRWYFILKEHVYAQNACTAQNSQQLEREQRRLALHWLPTATDMLGVEETGSSLATLSYRHA